MVRLVARQVEAVRRVRAVVRLPRGLCGLVRPVGSTVRLKRGQVYKRSTDASTFFLTSYHSKFHTPSLPTLGLSVMMLFFAALAAALAVTAHGKLFQATYARNDT